MALVPPGTSYSDACATASPRSAGTGGAYRARIPKEEQSGVSTDTNSLDTVYQSYSPAKRPTMADMASDEKVGADAKEAKSHLFGS